MKNIITNCVALNAGNILYIPVPCRGNVVSVKATSGATLVATKTITVARGGDAVNTATAPTGGTAAGTILEGVPDSTNKALIFDPDSSDATHKVLKVSFEAALLASDGNITLTIEYDDSAYVKQSASEA